MNTMNTPIILGRNKYGEIKYFVKRVKHSEHEFKCEICDKPSAKGVIYVPYSKGLLQKFTTYVCSRECAEKVNFNPFSPNLKK